MMWHSWQITLSACIFSLLWLNSLSVINAQKSTEVELNKVARCKRENQRSDSEVHLGVDRNRAGTVDISARVQMGQMIIYVMIGIGAYGSSGVAWIVIAYLWKVFALPRMLYGM